MPVNKIGFLHHLPAEPVKFDQAVAFISGIVFVIPLIADLLRSDIFIFQGSGVGVIVDLIEVKNAVSPAIDPDGKTVNFSLLTFADVTHQIVNVFKGHISLPHEFAHRLTFSRERKAGTPS